MACGGCGHKYFRPPRRNVGGVARASLRGPVKSWRDGRAAAVNPTADNDAQAQPATKVPAIDEKPKES